MENEKKPGVPQEKPASPPQEVPGKPRRRLPVGKSAVKKNRNAKAYGDG